jgi:hypothetical protein
VLITLTAKIFSGSHTKESHARMRNKTDNPLPETTQAPPARLIFDPLKWVALTPAFGRYKSLVGGPNNLAATCFDRDVHEELLELALVAPDGTYRVPDAAERQKLTIRVPLNYEEGCSIEPYHEGRWYVLRSDLDKRTTIPSPAARAEAEPASSGLLSPSAELPRSPQTEPTLSPSEPSATREPPAEDVERQRLLRLPEEPQFEQPIRRRPEEAKAWLAEQIANDPPKSGESKNEWARRKYPDMTRDFEENIPWTEGTLRRRMDD